ncbi:hypothetical protein CC1G_14293 [Coprinopsis cinerea okayama7|uniref:Integrase catalytic domain-containing protein n=1 Tax=Coprinopsis cinerea (strain Okayama-7 / 130 / ATCC MYA-4618 / FGSC 9003) TaxID=240176 RepID=D6RLH5_COPC7|nr:hypothetical protein CC1G_14293 [Coprinopsis cinerea okayama7\|eukprot:XP_002911763.1 hypothetical protein CC1G_14293 [Coprinopsis cinerea okayama7\
MASSFPSTRSSHQSTRDFISTFLSKAQKAFQDARFASSSIPNLERTTAEHHLYNLNAIKNALPSLSSPYITEDDIQQCHSFLDPVINELQLFLSSSPKSQRPTPSVSRNGIRGRPSYQLDLGRMIELHNMGNSWESIGDAFGVDRTTIWRHLERAGLSTKRPDYTEISNDDLDDAIAVLVVAHPLTGARVMQGHLQGLGINVPLLRVEKSLKRVDYVGTVLRWNGMNRRRVYRVRGSNALWHHDGNEKLKPWGFYVHGCVDGYSRLFIYLVCSNNKRSATVAACFMEAVSRYGWPSRMRGDFGTENNEVERRMNARWGALHRAYLRGKSLNNIRMERGWRDVRKESLEFFRQIFMELEELGLLDPNNPIHLVCLYVVFQPRIQTSLDRAIISWNRHKMSTAGNKTPLAMYELSRTKAINAGYWTGDPGDAVEEIDDEYGVDGTSGLAPPDDELASDPIAPRSDSFGSKEEEREAGIFVTEDDHIAEAREVLKELDLEADDGNWAT